MSRYEIVARGDVVARWVEHPSILEQHPDCEEAVDGIWERAVAASGGRLFNGTLPNLLGISRENGRIVLTGHFIEYKCFLAQLEHPELELGVEAIGVSGLTSLVEDGREYIVFARRAAHTTQSAGKFELVPSGTIDRSCALADGTIDYRSKLREEFAEETCLPEGLAREIRGFAVAHDPVDRSHDICCIVRTDASRRMMLEGLARSSEYYEPMLVPREELGSFVSAHERDVVATSLAIIEAYAEADDARG